MEFAELAAMAGAHAEARAIQVALKIGIFELLAQGSQGESGIADTLGTDRRATMLLANAMVALGLLEKQGGNYRLSGAAGRYLVQSSPEYLGGMILFDEAIFPYWAKLEDSIRSGASARSHAESVKRPRRMASALFVTLDCIEDAAGRGEGSCGQARRLHEVAHLRELFWLRSELRPRGVAAE